MVEANGDDDARPDVGTAPAVVAAPEDLVDGEFSVLHHVARLSSDQLDAPFLAVSIGRKSDRGRLANGRNP